MPKRETESQRLRKLIIPALEDTETVRAEGRFHPDFTGNRSYIVITDRRILWRHVGAAWSEKDFPLKQLEFQHVREVRETSTGNRCYFAVAYDRPQASVLGFARPHKAAAIVFGFSRPNTAAANALRERMRELGMSV
jgi:hypothetical protein